MTFRIQQVWDEGTSSPFVARMLKGILEMRNLLVLGNIDPRNRQITKEEFDIEYDPILTAMRAMRDACREIDQVVEAHKEAVGSGKIVSFQPGAYVISESIDAPLHRAIGNLLDQGTIAAKNRLQELLREFMELDVGFLFQRPGPFQRGLESLRNDGHTEFAGYLEKVREEWSQDFLDLRTDYHHDKWRLPAVDYRQGGPSEVSVLLPKVGADSVDVFSKKATNRVLLFVENAIAYGVQASGRAAVVLQEIPKEQRDPSNCKRFQAVPTLPGVQPWKITFRDDMDFV